MTTGARRRGRGSSAETAKAESEKAPQSATGGDGSERASSGSRTTSTRSGADAERPKLTRAEAGRLGGLRTRELYGSKHYKDIGKQGGAKGGAVTKQKYGSEHYRRIGSLRGKRTSEAGGQSSSSTSAPSQR